MAKRNTAKKQTGTLTAGKTVKTSIIIIAVTAAMIFLGVVGIEMFYKFGLDTYFTKNNYKANNYMFAADIDAAVSKISDVSANKIKALPKVYVIPREQYESPVPIAENYDDTFSNYSDDTITAHYYSEKYYGSVFHFIDVTVAHPSQIRMALANNKYGSSKKRPQAIAKNVNAVAAVDGCYYNRRSNGVLIYQGKTYRMRASGLYVLLIDSEGDFHIVKDYEVKSSGILEQYDIVNSVTFGPALVLDGKAQKIKTGNWEPHTKEPRAAIAQMGKLHYLICTVDGRQSHSAGVTTQQFANVLAEKNCQTAYNLDGGQSATLIMGGKVKNRVAYGGQRELGDILYFATALDEN